jgi:hypothetical protein
MAVLIRSGFGARSLRTKPASTGYFRKEHVSQAPQVCSFKFLDEDTGATMSGFERDISSPPFLHAASLLYVQSLFNAKIMQAARYSPLECGQPGRQDATPEPLN